MLSPFPQNLRFLRRLKGLSQQELANRLGLKRNNIASYELGTVEPKVETLIQIAVFFNCTPEELLAVSLWENSVIVEETDEEQAVAEEGHYPLLLEELIQRTEQAQKIYDGYQAFHDMRKEVDGSTSSLVRGLENDLDNLFTMLSSTLENNWQFIRHSVSTNSNRMPKNGSEDRPTDTQD